MIELGLQRITRLLARTPLPWRAIHVAGTNGKGSVCVYVSGMLDAYNKSSYRNRRQLPPIKHARFTSPHLIDRWDCISINQKTVPSTLFHEVESRVLARNKAEKIDASEFEILTATAFEIFTQEQVDIGVIEVGMGGRLDATNVLGQSLERLPYSLDIVRAVPLVTAITNIGLDHQAFLGNTLGEIAREKAGILKQGVPAVFAQSNEPEVLDVLNAVAMDVGAKATSLAGFCLPSSNNLEAEMARVLSSPRTEGLDLATGVQPTAEALPAHTRQNTTLAFQSVWLALQQLERVPSDCTTLSEQDQEPVIELVRSLLAVPSSTSFPGRLQTLDIAPLTGRQEPILLDGAHNAQSATVLAEAVLKLRRASSSEGAALQPITWVLAASDTKDIASILALLMRPGDGAAAVEFGPVDGMPWVRAMDGEKVLEAARRVINGNMKVIGIYGRDVVGGLRAACDAADGGPLVVAGSLYLVGSVLKALGKADTGANGAN